VNDKVSPAQVEAIGKWGVQQKGSNDYLKTIKQPTLIVNGSNDVDVPTVNSFIMQQNMPNAQLIIYPDSNHGRTTSTRSSSSVMSRVPVRMTSMAPWPKVIKEAARNTK